MKLSEAMMLGYTMGRELNNGSWDTCLIGISCHAVSNSYYTTLGEAYDRWPWIGISVPHPQNTEFLFPPYLILTELCGEVIAGRTTIEQVVDWVRSVEPEEPTPAAPGKEEVPEPETCLM